MRVNETSRTSDKSTPLHTAVFTSLLRLSPAKNISESLGSWFWINFWLWFQKFLALGAQFKKPCSHPPLLCWWREPGILMQTTQPFDKGCQLPGCRGPNSLELYSRTTTAAALGWLLHLDLRETRLRTQQHWPGFTKSLPSSPSSKSIFWARRKSPIPSRNSFLINLTLFCNLNISATSLTFETLAFLCLFTFKALQYS